MKTDTLRDVLSQVETYCVKNELLVFQGALSTAKRSASADWEGEGPEDWKAFLSLAKKCDVKIIYLTDTRYEVDEEDLEGFSQLLLTLNDEEKALYADKLTCINAHLGKVENFTISFSFNQTCHCYYVEDAGLEDFYSLLAELEAKAETAAVEEPLQSNPACSEEAVEIDPAMDYTEVEKMAQEIVGSPSFQNVKVKEEIHSIAYDHWAASGGEDRRFYNSVYWQVCKAFSKKVADECREKIKTIRLERPELKKVEVAGLLDISPNKVSKYWGPRDVSDYE